ncbi:MAG: TolC family protein [Candidatus Omnitrophota bacterium]
MLSRLILGVLISFFSVTMAEPSAATQVLSFETFFQRVLAYYPGLKAAHGDVTMALAGQMQARAGFWPSLNISAGYQLSNDPVNVFGMLLRQERFTSGDFDLKRLNTPEVHQDITAGIHLDWPLFDAMQTIYRVRGSHEDVKASRAQEDFVRMEALLLAQDAYLNALTLERLSGIMDVVKSSSDDDLQKASDLKDKGMILGADYYLARVLSGDFERIKNEMAHQKKAMMILLNIMMGESLDTVWILQDMIKDKTLEPKDRPELLAAAFTYRLDLLSLKAQLEASVVAFSRERSSALPQVSLFADAANDRDRIFRTGGDNFTAGLKVQMSLFDPTRDGRVQMARAKAEKLKQQVEVLKDSIRRDIVQETARYDILRDNMAALKGMADDAKESMSLMVPLYSEGRKSIADLLEVRRTYWQSAQAYHMAFLGLWASSARLEFLSGRLNEDALNKLMEGAGL